MCGNPFVEYHHIDPWKDEHHFDPSRMIAICPTCHDRFHRMKKEKQYRIKRDPINVRTGRVKGFLEYNVPLDKIVMGSNEFNRCMNLIGYNGDVLLSWRVMEGEYLISAVVRAKSGGLLLVVEDNEIIFMYKDFWDVKFRFNFLQMKSLHGAHNILFDFRKYPAELTFKSFIAGNSVVVKKDAVVLSRENGSTLTVSNSTFSDITGCCLVFVEDGWEPRNDTNVLHGVMFGVIPSPQYKHSPLFK